MWTFHGNLSAKGGRFCGTSYLKAHPLETVALRKPNLHSDRGQNPSDPKVRMVSLYHGGSLDCTTASHFFSSTVTGFVIKKSPKSKMF
ncbi:hypothetical protein E2C01_085333 [Portunus trituberculatus]|uniref:Uncharacterized protein n=1 Tax=Portunus trituberculatus TaxID=210409 RepID=A0A5B7J2D6_PORTR|nr:hypothetical protein [Portunus trituberculatus]